MMPSELLRNVKMLKSMMDGTLQREVFEQHHDEIIANEREQLLEGKAGSGKDLRPYYSEDLKPNGWFHSRDSAGRYAAWKGSLTYPVSVQRNSDAPNLYITGVFHGDLDVAFGVQSIFIIPSTSYASQIMAKYGNRNFMLTDERWNALIKRDGGIRDELLTKMRAIIWS